MIYPGRVKYLPPTTVGPPGRNALKIPSMLIQGDDLHLLSRSGNQEAKSTHDGNLITFHTIGIFRRMIY